jgi:phosphotransferase family enzyme
MSDHVVNTPVCLTHPSETEVARILALPEVVQRLGARTGTVRHATHLGGTAYQVAGSTGNLVVRFPGDPSQVAMLRREERVRRGLHSRVSARLPDTTVVDDIRGCPVFAVHSMIPGQPLTTEILEQAPPEARERLVTDLVQFFDETHRVPLHIACTWLDIPFGGKRTVSDLACARGKPAWFDPDAVAALRPRIVPLLCAQEAALFEDTVRRFEALHPNPTYMVFGHGDMHGYNMAIAQDGSGLRLIGAFDLGCTGILDIHEDLFRLSLIGEALLDSVIAVYQGLTGQTRSLNRDRLSVYYRAFLFYLMSGKSGTSLQHLRRLLDSHIAYGET